MVPKKIQTNMEVVDEEIAQIDKRVREIIIARYDNVVKNVNKLDLEARREFFRTSKQELLFENARRTLAQFLRQRLLARAQQDQEDQSRVQDEEREDQLRVQDEHVVKELASSLTSGESILREKNDDVESVDPIFDKFDKFVEPKISSKTPFNDEILFTDAIKIHPMASDPILSVVTTENIDDIFETEVNNLTMDLTLDQGYDPPVFMKTLYKDYDLSIFGGVQLGRAPMFQVKDQSFVSKFLGTRYDRDNPDLVLGPRNLFKVPSAACRRRFKMN